MINYFKGWIYVLIAISIISLLIELILPKTNLKKYIYMVTGILVILLLISPFVNILKEDSIDQAVAQVVNKMTASDGGYTKEDIEKMLDNKNKTVLKTVVEKMNADIKVKAEKYGLIVENTVVSIDDKYDIEEIIIEAKNKVELERIKSVIKYISEIYNIPEQNITIKCEVV